MNPYVEIYYYEDGLQESKVLFTEGTARAFKEHGLDILDVNEGDTFTLINEDESEISVKVYQIDIDFDNNKKKYHVAPPSISSFQYTYK